MNVPLSHAGVVPYPPFAFLLGTGGLLLAYARSAASLVVPDPVANLVLVSLSGVPAGQFPPLEYLLATGSPLLVSGTFTSVRSVSAGRRPLAGLTEAVRPELRRREESAAETTGAFFTRDAEFEPGACTQRPAPERAARWSPPPARRLWAVSYCRSWPSEDGVERAGLTGLSAERMNHDGSNMYD